MKEPEDLCLAVIQQVHTKFPNTHRISPIPYYEQTGPLDPADIKSIQCVVGHVEDRKKYGLVDCSGPLCYALTLPLGRGSQLGLGPRNNGQERNGLTDPGSGLKDR